MLKIDLTNLKRTFITFIKERVFWLINGLIIISLTYGLFVFYTYALAPINLPEKPASNIKIKTEQYQKIINELDTRQKNLEQPLIKNHRDIFQPIKL